MIKNLQKITSGLAIAAIISSSTITPVFAASNSVQATKNKIIIKDVQPPYTPSYHTVTSTHFQEYTVGAIATLLCGEFGGKAANYLMCGSAIATAYATESSSDVYEDVYYSWAYSGDDEQPYRIKQFIVYYSDAELTHYITSSTRYYLSNMTY